jgi:hypothetical protein
MIVMIAISPFRSWKEELSRSLSLVYLSVSMIVTRFHLARTHAEACAHLRTSAYTRASMSCYHVGHVIMLSVMLSRVVRNLLTTCPSKSDKMSLCLFSWVWLKIIVALFDFWPGNVLGSSMRRACRSTSACFDFPLCSVLQRRKFEASNAGHFHRQVGNCIKADHVFSLNLPGSRVMSAASSSA